jgi:hypothetical protein
MSNAVVRRIRQRIPVTPSAGHPGIIRSQLHEPTGQKTVAYIASLIVAVVLVYAGFNATSVAEVIGVSALFAHQVGN